ncbi:MAG: PAS domain S-box protein, partial [Oxalobacteraceae bacterium]
MLIRAALPTHRCPRVRVAGAKLQNLGTRVVEQQRRWAPTQILRSAASRGNIRGLCCAKLNLTGHRPMGKRVDQAHQGDIRSRALLARSPFAVQSFSPDGRCIMVSAAWQRMWRLADETVATLLQSYNFFEDRAVRRLGLHKLFRRALGGESVATKAQQYQPNDLNSSQNNRWVETHFIPLQEDDGTVFEILLVFKDVTDRKTSEAIARRSHHQMQAIIDNSNAAIYVKARDGVYLLLNREFGRLFARDSQALLGKCDKDMFPADVVQRLYENDQLVMCDGKGTQTEEIVPLPDGPHVFVSNKFPLRDDNGLIYAICGISTDITAMRRVENEKQELLRRERAALELADLKTQFLATMS